MQSIFSSKRWILFSISVIGIVLIVLVARENGANEAQLAGTMSEITAAQADVVLEDIKAAWSEGDDERSNYGRLDDTFGVTIKAVNQTDEIKEEQLTLYFSRDDNFNRDEDCQIAERTFRVEPNADTEIQFRSTGRIVDCLDAGPWFAAVYSSEGFWTVLDEVYHVGSGDAEVEIAELAPHVIPDGSIEMQLRVHRPRTITGYDGLYEFPIDIWLAQDGILCLFEAETISVPRDRVVGSGESYKPSYVDFTLDLARAKMVDVSSMSTSPFAMNEELGLNRDCENCEQQQQELSCQLTEGPLKVTAGPTDLEFQVVQETYHHAPPVSIESGLFEVTVTAGETVDVFRTVYNPSVDDVTWSISSDNGSDWFIGKTNQPLRARASSEIGFSVSATDLSPGTYTTTAQLAATDFYGTTVEVEVEVTVLAASETVTDALTGETVDELDAIGVDVEDGALPTSFSLGNYPNPFNPSTTIRFQLPQGEHVSLIVYDLTGRQVRVLHEGTLSSGLHEFRFDADQLPSGTYLYRLITPSMSKTEQMILVK